MEKNGQDELYSYKNGEIDKQTLKTGEFFYDKLLNCQVSI